MSCINTLVNFICGKSYCGVAHRGCLTAPRLHFASSVFPALRCVHICMRTQTRQAEARHMQTYALIAIRGKMLSFAEPVNDSLWSTDSRRIAFVRPQTEEAVFLSSVTRLHCYTCLASACLARIFVLMWTWLYTCAEASCALNESTSACHDALVCTANFRVHEQPRFASCAA